MSCSSVCLSSAHVVQILCEQRHALLLPQGIRGFSAEADGSLCCITLQGNINSLYKQNPVSQCPTVFFWLICWPAGFQNSPNDLQMLSDAPAHHLFCLLPPVPPTQNSLPEVLAVVQVGLKNVNVSCMHLKPNSYSILGISLSVKPTRHKRLSFILFHSGYCKNKLSWLSVLVFHCIHWLFGSVGMFGGRNISSVHPEQSVQRKKGLWWPHSLDGVRTGTGF